MIRFIVLTVSLVFFVNSASARTWRDATGKFSIEAEFAGLANGKVRLKKEGGKIIEVPLSRLSEADKEFISAKRASPKKKAKPSVRAKAPGLNWTCKDGYLTVHNTGDGDCQINLKTRPEKKDDESKEAIAKFLQRQHEGQVVGIDWKGRRVVITVHPVRALPTGPYLSDAERIGQVHFDKWEVYPKESGKKPKNIGTPAEESERNKEKEATEWLAWSLGRIRELPGRPDFAAAELSDFVERFPGTKAAAQAEKMLKRLPRR